MIDILLLVLFYSKSQQICNTANNKPTNETVIPVGKGPTAIVITPNEGKYVYVVNDGGSVSVIDTKSNSELKLIPISGMIARNPRRAVITPDGKRVYITYRNTYNVLVIDTETNEILESISKIGRCPNGIAITPDGKFVYVTNDDSEHISVIDTKTNTIVDSIPVRSGTSAIAITPNGKYAYATNAYDNDVLVIDITSNSLLGTIPVEKRPNGIVITPNGDYAYVINSLSNSISVIDVPANKVINAISVLGRPLENGVILTPDGKKLYVINFPYITMIDTETNKINYTIYYPFGNSIAITPDGKTVYITNRVDNTVSVKNLPIKLTLDTAMKEAGVNITTVNNVQYYDYSTPIHTMIKKNVEECFKVKEEIMEDGIPHAEEILASFLYFGKNVAPNKPWDLKIKKRWEEQLPGVKYLGLKGKFVLDNNVYDSEQLGNITFGYWGSALGYGPKTLYWGGGVANKGKLSHEELEKPPYYGDTSEDHEMIEKGINWLNADYPNNEIFYNGFPTRDYKIHELCKILDELGLTEQIICN
ncbi:beta-propeller fold lactonase family protein [Vallitalea guaymasensis]|uniref:beta-propeller fold lactonase family protein n=1 Tax=Vallitalea guaymasensis TaxID=1185412 RepID=UPI00272BCFC9|nr:beta-propeller fold lactonase family protein [Vallitalea guaymasensis]